VIAQANTNLSFVRGVQITCQGEEPDALYIVRFGTVSIWVNHECIMDKVCGTMFGENALFGEESLQVGSEKVCPRPRLT